jgi:hypothetical protein
MQVLKVLAITIIFTVSIFSCNNRGDSNAIVLQDKTKELEHYVFSLPLITNLSRFGGCHLISHYIAYNLEKDLGTIVSKIFVHRGLKEPIISYFPGRGRQEWNFHAALLIDINSNGRTYKYVIDAGNINHLISYSDWLKLLGLSDDMKKDCLRVKNDSIYFRILPRQLLRDDNICDTPQNNGSVSSLAWNERELRYAYDWLEKK